MSAELELRARARLAAEWDRAATDVAGFIPLATPDYSRPVELAPVTELLNRSLHEPVFACLSLPPRHKKTDTILHAAVHRLKFQPKARIGYFSYSSDFALKKSRAARSIAVQVGLKPGGSRSQAANEDLANTVHYWQTSSGSSWLASGRGGEAIGHGLDLAIVDDPFSGPVEARSAAVREAVWDWFLGSIFQRREPGASIFVVHTRWHEDDLIGRLIASEGNWTYINLPALALDNDPIGRKPGEALCPERYTADELNLIRLQIGEYLFWAQYQGQPRPEGAKLFRPPARIDELPILLGWRVFIGVDPAGTTKTSSDNTAVAVMAFRRDPKGLLHAIVLRVYCFQAEVPDVTDFLLALQKRWEGAPLVIETQGGHGAAVAQMLRRIEPRLVLATVTTTEDKFTRAQPVAAGWNQGRVLVPTQSTLHWDSEEVQALLKRWARWDTSWVKTYLDEMGKVTGVADPEDDQMDATAHCWNYAETAVLDATAEQPKGMRPRLLARGY
jgi:hypothetical protein